MGLAAALCLGAGPALAQSAYPSRPVTLIVPFGTGGATDVIARLVAQGFADTAKWNVVVENKAGAGGTLGSGMVARAAPDGYTWLLGTTGSYTANQFLYKALPYQPDKDFVPIAMIGQIPNLLVATPSLGMKDVQQFLKAANTLDSHLSYSSSGAGTSGHLAVEQLRMYAPVNAVHVPYKNAGQGYTDLVGGRISFAIDNFPVLLPFVKSGKLVPLAITGKTRSPLLPDVPTMEESGVKGYENTVWFGLFLPKDVPADTRKSIIDTTAKVLGSADLQNKLTAQGITVRPLAGSDFAAFLVQDRAKTKAIIEKAAIEPM
ncbi:MULTISPECIES: tripartite tricarboxylate transporter substrate binding protein [unclassified Achromobacter]|uniref:Bug family tripartite tricarboxylate transporter substrate binding protein n=1 Tax=unclassified Achromobacter TaxID=2626865 RepID=UPI0013039A4E|nr:MULTISPECIES: tripartite tricarboxylate transporter substrate binding protein [unclassified Achromobacter]